MFLRKTFKVVFVGAALSLMLTTSSAQQLHNDETNFQIKKEPTDAAYSKNIATTNDVSSASTLSQKLEKNWKFFADLKARAFKGNAEGTTSVSQKPTAAEDTAELSKKLSNPVASLISFPIQANFDFGMGTGSGWRSTTNIQPVIPIALNAKWNLISRTIVPIIHQGNVVSAGTSQNGLGDIVQSLFFSPNKSEPFIWGIGPAILIPSATNKFLGSKQLGLGPTVVVLKQQHGWTVGALWNHIWKVSGGSGRSKV